MSLYLNWLKNKISKKRPGSIVSCGNYRLRINDGPNFFILYKDIFLRRIYHFQAQRATPLVLDCGANIGVSILYFKYIYPGARIIGFEPDPRIFPYLEENLKRNNLKDVRIIQAALDEQEGKITFYSDAKFQGTLAKYACEKTREECNRYEVDSTRLRDYLTEPVDFLKMNIEGAEWQVLLDSADRLRHIREMVVEYHHLPGLTPTLHNILELLDQEGFSYLINDFDAQTNLDTQPPFKLHRDTKYYLLIYAKRRD